MCEFSDSSPESYRNLLLLKADPGPEQGLAATTWLRNATRGASDALLLGGAFAVRSANRLPVIAGGQCNSALQIRTDRERERERERILNNDLIRLLVQGPRSP